MQTMLVLGIYVCSDVARARLYRRASECCIPRSHIVPRYDVCISASANLHIHDANNAKVKLIPH